MNLKSNQAYQLNQKLEALVKIGPSETLAANADIGVKEIPTESIIELVLVALSDVGVALSRSKKGWWVKVKLAYIGVKLIYDMIKLRNEKISH